MPITEIVIPFLKQDELTHSTFKSLAPILSNALSSAPGVIKPFIAPMISQNGVDVLSAVKYALGVEWEKVGNYETFVTSPAFQAFGGQVKPLATAAAPHELYDTDLSPLSVFSSPLTEVFRIKIGNHPDVVKETWIAFITAVEISVPGLPSLSGTSLNLEEQLFLGVVGWEGVEEREHIVGEKAVKDSKSKLESLNGVDSFTISFAAQ